MQQRVIRSNDGVRCKHTVSLTSSNLKASTTTKLSPVSTVGRRHADGAIGLFDRVAACFIDHRDPDCTVHSVQTLVGQRIAAIALGYEDVDDHETLRHDPVLALLSESLTPKRSDCGEIGAQVRVSVRRIKVAMASACSYADEFALAHARIRAAAR